MPFMQRDGGEDSNSAIPVMGDVRASTSVLGGFGNYCQKSFCHSDSKMMICGLEMITVDGHQRLVMGLISLRLNLVDENGKI